MTRARSLATSAPLAYRDWHTATFPRRRYPPPLRRAPRPPTFHGAEDAARAVAFALAHVHAPLHSVRTAAHHTSGREDRA